MKMLTIATLALCLTSGVAFAAVDTTGNMTRQIAPKPAAASHQLVAHGPNRWLTPSIRPSKMPSGRSPSF